jgi:hypothetical protein
MDVDGILEAINNEGELFTGNDFFIPDSFKWSAYFFIAIGTSYDEMYLPWTGCGSLWDLTYMMKEKMCWLTNGSFGQIQIKQNRSVAGWNSISKIFGQKVGHDIGWSLFQDRAVRGQSAKTILEKIRALPDDHKLILAAALAASHKLIGGGDLVNRPWNSVKQMYNQDGFASDSMYGEAIEDVDGWIDLKGRFAGSWPGRPVPFGSPQELDGTYARVKPSSKLGYYIKGKET